MRKGIELLLMKYKCKSDSESFAPSVCYYFEQIFRDMKIKKCYHGTVVRINMFSLRDF